MNSAIEPGERTARTEPPASSYDVVIVGARCAGAATAMLLARAGHRVLMVDRGRYGTDTLSTHALMRGAIVQLHRWGVLPSVIAAGTPPVRQATFIYGGDTVTVPIKPREGIDALYAPRRHVLDRLLVDAAVAAGTDVVYGTRLRGLERSANGRVTGVVLQEDSGRAYHVSSRLVVGADGLRSTLARLVGAVAYRVGRHATATIYGHWSGIEVGGYEWYWGPGMSAGAIPTNEGQVCAFVALPGAAFTGFVTPQKAAAQAVFCDRLSHVAPALADQIRRAATAGLHGFPGHVGFFRQSYGPGWALVGDAGYFKDPLTSHGITDAFRDAQLLAAAIDAGGDNALADYQVARDAASTELFEATDAIASFSWDLNSVRALHEQLAKAMAREVQQLYTDDPRTNSWPRASASAISGSSSTPASSGAATQKSA